jgi:hypothetical protein
VGFWNAKKVGEQLRLTFGIGFSYVISGTFAMGTALLSGASYPRSVGTGLVSASVMATVAYRRSALSRGTTVALPAAEADVELSSNTQVITR